MSATIKRNDVCVVQVTIETWPRWYFARVLECQQDEQDNWEINKVRVIGEDFDRDEDGFSAVYRIEDEEKQQAATKLATAQWGNLVSYADIATVRKTILAACT